MKTLAALLLTASLASASSACLEKRPASDSAQFVRVVDAEGKKHRFSLFILGEESFEEFGDWMTSRKTAAMDPARTLYLKTSGGVDTLRSVTDCPASKRAALKM
jgi:hypothetical protein